MQADYAELLTIDELCDILMIGRTTAYTLLRSGELNAFKIGRVWKISKVSVENYVRQRSNL